MTSHLVVGSEKPTMMGHEQKEKAGGKQVKQRKESSWG